MTTATEIAQKAMLLAEDIANAESKRKGFGSYDILYARREWQHLKDGYIQLTGDARGFPQLINAS